MCFVVVTADFPWMPSDPLENDRNCFKTKKTLGIVLEKTRTWAQMWRDHLPCACMPKVESKNQWGAFSSAILRHPVRSIWVKYNISLTWNLRPFGDDSPNRDSSLRSQWGLYNVPRSISGHWGHNMVAVDCEVTSMYRDWQASIESETRKRWETFEMRCK